VPVVGVIINRKFTSLVIPRLICGLFTHYKVQSKTMFSNTDNSS